MTLAPIRDSQLLFLVTMLVTNGIQFTWRHLKIQLETQTQLNVCDRE